MFKHTTKIIQIADEFKNNTPKKHRLIIVHVAHVTGSFHKNTRNGGCKFI
jgi:hypothetical protein